MFYFANNDYRFLLANKDTDGFEDGCLVLCEQMIEKVLKGLLKEEKREYQNTCNLKLLLRSCSFDNKYKAYLSLCSDLTDCYFERRYETDEYYEYSKEEYEELVIQSIEFYKLLLKERKNIVDTAYGSLKRLNIFND